jgi:hypothetical protein
MDLRAVGVFLGLAVGGGFLGGFALGGASAVALEDAKLFDELGPFFAEGNLGHRGLHGPVRTPEGPSSRTPVQASGAPAWNRSKV